LNFDGMPPPLVSKLSLSSLFGIFVSHLSTNQAWPCLAFETRWDWACLGWFGRRLKIFLNWSFSFFYCEDLVFSWILFVSSVLVLCRSGGDNEQIRWESVPTRLFLANLSNKEA
jgi:hypothetical protein